MKTLKALIYLLLFGVGATLIIWFLYGLIISQLDTLIEEGPKQVAQTENSPDQTIKNEDQQSTKAELVTNILDANEANSINAKEVSTTDLSSLQDAYFQTIGTIHSTGVVTIYPLTAGSVKAVNFEQGDYIKEGKTIIELGGMNSTEHVSETQLKIAEASLNNAKASLENLKKTSKQSLSTAGLQLQSAMNKASAIEYDLAIIERNKAGLDKSVSLLENSLSNTREMSSRNHSKGVNDLDDLIFMLNDAQDVRGRTQRQINDVQDEINKLKRKPEEARKEETNIPSNEKPKTVGPNSEEDVNAQKLAMLEEQLVQLKTALKAQNTGIDKIFSTIDTAKHGLATAENGSELSENQLIGQISQSKSQADVLDLTLSSTKTKLGYTGSTSDAVQLSQQAYNTTKVQLESAIDNTANQVKLAELNVEMSKSQVAALNIKAPFNGIITMLDLYPGQTVSPQQPVAEILDPKKFRLEVGVDINTANRIAKNRQAQIELGGRRIDVPITSIGLKIDEKTKLVKVTIDLPNIFFKLNQNMKVYLPLSVGSGTTSSTRSIPLDAVIIGSETQFIFINEHGKAKRVEVELGEIAGDQVEIKTKLPSNSEIILDGAKDLVDGQTIQPINAK